MAVEQTPSDLSALPVHPSVDGHMPLEPLREVGDDPDLAEWVRDQRIEVVVYQAQDVATESLRITRQTLAEIAEETERFIAAHPAVETHVRSMAEEVSDLLSSVPERALRNHLSKFDHLAAAGPDEPAHPTPPNLWARLQHMLPRFR